ncbi:MAG: hypothetical protein RBR82_01680 [Pseudomonas sp.]|nr:hypothetical protein [Pseudomonas sp.]
MLTNFGRLSVLAIVLSMSACAVMQPKTTEENVLKLAEKRQTALLAQDFKKAYKYMSPGYRELNTVENLMSDYAGVYSWKSSDVLNATCDDGVCRVNVKVFVDIGLMQSAATPDQERVLVPRVNRETWIKLDNKWWFSKSE